MVHHEPISEIEIGRNSRDWSASLRAVQNGYSRDSTVYPPSQSKTLDDVSNEFLRRMREDRNAYPVLR
ncbi:hypothetical protein FRC15_012135 [Serendipita sp. 397]|nr:hypothetical protein FRC15_012135 [Serendipita sp. 397]